MINFKKINVDECRREGFGMKPYLKEMNLTDARMFYRIKYNLVPTIRLNQKSNRRYKAENWLCPDCLSQKTSLTDLSNYYNYDYDDNNICGFFDDQHHVQYSCIANHSMRSKMNFDEPKEVVKFSKRLSLEERSKTMTRFVQDQDKFTIVSFV